MENRHTILIVDDEPFNLDILQENLEDDGYEVVRAEDGPSALRIIESDQFTFSTILLDRMMPHMDGLEVLKNLKQSETYKHLPVIIQTAAATDKDVMEGIEAGAFYYLTKPFEPELMLTIVKSAISDYENYRTTSELQHVVDHLMPLVDSLSLKFRTIEEAQMVAGRISNFYPDPDRVLLGLTELLINAIEHGNLGITYEEKSTLIAENTWRQEIQRRLADDKYRSKKASVEIKKSDTEISIVIKDEGEGFQWENFLDMTAERAHDSHGRGIAMAGMISFDAMEYRGKGNEVCCIVKF